MKNFYYQILANLIAMFLVFIGVETYDSVKKIVKQEKKRKEMRKKKVLKK